MMATRMRVTACKFDTLATRLVFAYALDDRHVKRVEYC
jgi:hypothetical protein